MKVLPGGRLDFLILLKQQDGNLGMPPPIDRFEKSGGAARSGGAFSVRNDSGLPDLDVDVTKTSLWSRACFLLGLDELQCL